jgi:hypothetical protein
MCETLSNHAMKLIGEVRRQRLAILMAETGMSLTDVTVKLGRTRRDSTLSQIVNQAPDSKTGKPRQMGDPQARQIETTFGKPAGWMDRDPDFDSLERALSDAHKQLAELQVAETPGVYRFWPFVGLSLARVLRLPPDRLKIAQGAIVGIVEQFERESSLLGNGTAA